MGQIRLSRAGHLSAAAAQTQPDLLAMARGKAAGDSFYIATLMFQRARQLRDGARPRVDARGHTVTRVAFLEVLAGLVCSTGVLADIAEVGR